MTGSLLPSNDMLLLQKTELYESPEQEAASDMHFLNGSHARSKETPDVVANAADLRSWWGQQIPFSAIVRSGAIVKKSDGNYGEGGGFTMGASHFFYYSVLKLTEINQAWDNCSNTPVIYRSYTSDAFDHSNNYTFSTSSIPHSRLS